MKAESSAMQADLPGIDTVSNDPELLPARRVSAYAVLRAESLEQADWIDEHEPKESLLAGRLRRCGNRLEFTMTAAGTYRLSWGMFCNLPNLCPLCAARRATRLAYEASARVHAALLERPGTLAFFVTLTYHPTADLFAAVTDLRALVSGFHKYGQKVRREKNRSPGTTEASCVLGAAHFTEIKWPCGRIRNPAHPLVFGPHDHAVWLCDRAPDASELSREWAQLTGGSWKVDVLPFYAHAGAAGGIPFRGPVGLAIGDSAGGDPTALAEGLSGDAFRVVRYALKKGHSLCRVRFETHRALTRGGTARAPRLRENYGVLRGPLPKKDASGTGGQGHGGVLVASWDGTTYQVSPRPGPESGLACGSGPDPDWV